MNFITNILQELLNYTFNFTGDLGIAIVIITLLVKLLLMPLSIKQRISTAKQQEFAKKIDNIKNKYKNNPKELEKQLQLQSGEGLKSLFGMFTIILQLPIIFTLFNIFRDLPKGYSTVIIPWVENLNVYDNLYIIPCIYAITMLAPNIISYIPFIKTKSIITINRSTVILTIIMSFILTARTPIALGIYFITSSLCKFIEDIIFKVYSNCKNRTILQN